MALAEKLRVLRVREKLSQRELAKKVEMSYATISKIESGHQQTISAKLAIALAEYFRIEPKDFLDDSISTSALLAKIEDRVKEKGEKYTAIPLENLLQIPVLAYVPCGMPTEIPEDIIMGRISLPFKWVRDKEAFAVIAKGDSMIGHGITQGDHIVVSPNLEAQSGSIALVEINGEVTVKKVVTKGDQIVLQPSNSHYDSILVTDKDEFRVIGKVVFSGRVHD